MIAPPTLAAEERMKEEKDSLIQQLDADVPLPQEGKLLGFFDPSSVVVNDRLTRKLPFELVYDVFMSAAQDFKAAGLVDEALMEVELEKIVLAGGWLPQEFDKRLSDMQVQRGGEGAGSKCN